MTVSGRRDQDWFFVLLTGFTNPGVVAQYEFKDGSDGEFKVWRETLVEGLAGAGGFVAEQVGLFFFSGDIVLRRSRCGTKARTVQMSPCSSCATKIRNSMARHLCFSMVRLCCFGDRVHCYSFSRRIWRIYDLYHSVL
jgi:hypothetical protein